MRFDPLKGTLRTYALFAALSVLLMVSSAVLNPLMNDLISTAGGDEGKDKANGTKNEDLRFVHRSYHLSPGGPYFTEEGDVAYTSGDTTYQAADLMFTEGVEDTKEIREVASNISTPDQAMSYVREKVLYKPYFGLMKGAHETLLQGEGNDADQSALMSAILRTNGVPCRFVTGTLEAPIAMVGNWIGSFDDNSTLDALMMNGIPSIRKDDRIIMDHIWMEAFTEGVWKSFDPSFVQYNYIAPKTSVEDLNLHLEEIALSYLDNSTFETDHYSMAEFDDTYFEAIPEDEWNKTIGSLMDLFTRSLGDSLNGSIEELDFQCFADAIYGKKEVKKGSLGSDVVLTPMGESPSIPSGLEFRAIIEVGGIRLNRSLPELLGKRLTLSYEIGSDGNSTYPNLRLDGAVLEIGEKAPIGVEQKLKIRIIGPSSFSTEDVSIVNAGSYYAISLDAGKYPADHLFERNERVIMTKSLISMGSKDIPTDETLGEMLYLVGAVYHHLSDLKYDSVANILEMNWVSYPTLLIIGAELNSYRDDIIQYQGIKMDMRFQLLNAFSRDGNLSTAIQFLLDTGLMMSDLETDALKRVIDCEIYSVKEVFETCESLGIPIYHITYLNSEVLQTLNISDEDSAMIEPYIDSGFTVIAPGGAVTINEWTGCGFKIMDQTNGSVLFLLSGGTSDPVTDVIVSIWDGSPEEAWERFFFDIAETATPYALLFTIPFKVAGIWAKNPCSFYANLIESILIAVNSLIENILAPKMIGKIFKKLQFDFYKIMIRKMEGNPDLIKTYIDKLSRNPEIKAKIDKFIQGFIDNYGLTKDQAINRQETLLMIAFEFAEEKFKFLNENILHDILFKMSTKLSDFLKGLESFQKKIMEIIRQYFPPDYKKCRPKLVSDVNPVYFGQVGKSGKVAEMLVIYDKSSGWDPHSNKPGQYMHGNVSWKISDDSSMKHGFEAESGSFWGSTVPHEYGAAPIGVTKESSKGWLSFDIIEGRIGPDNRIGLSTVKVDVGKYIEKHGYTSNKKVVFNVYITYTGEYEGAPREGTTGSKNYQPTIIRFVCVERVEVQFTLKEVTVGYHPQSLSFSLNPSKSSDEKTFLVKHTGADDTPTIDITGIHDKQSGFGAYAVVVSWGDASFLDPKQSSTIHVKATALKFPKKGYQVHLATVQINVKYQVGPNNFKHLKNINERIIVFISAKNEPDPDPTPPPPPDLPGGTHPDDAETSPQLLLRDPDDNFDDILRNAIRKDGSNSRILFRYSSYHDQLGGISDPIAERDRIVRITSSMSSLYERMVQNRTGLLTELNRAPDIMLLKNGFHEPMSDLLTRYREPFVYVTPEDFDHMMIEDFKVLIVPSGGFYGLSTSEAFKERLKLYAESGGSILSFSQLSGSELSVLPGDIGGFGYGEDQNCFYSAVYMETFTAALSGQTTTTPTVNVDGYFSLYPDNSTVMLRRTKNGMPALLSYPYGNGKVVASTLFSDWAYGAGGASSEELSFVRDLIYWSVRDVDLRVGPADGIEISFDVPNEGSFYGSPKTTGTDLAIALVGPDRTIREYVNETVEILPGDSLNHTFSHKALTEPGIWTIEHILTGKGGTILGDGFDAMRISVSKYAENPNGFTYKGNELQLWVESDTERAAKGSKILLRAFVRNNGDTEFKGNLAYGGHEARYEGGRFWAYYGAVQDITVRPGQVGVFPVTWTIDKSTSFYFGLYEKGQDWENLAKNTIMAESRISTEKGIWVYQPSLSVEISSDNEYYKEGEQVSLSIHLKNLRQSTTLGTLPVSVKDPNNKLVFNKVIPVNISSEGTKDIWVNFTLPADSTQGFYSASAEFMDPSGQRAGRGVCFFELPKDYSVSLVFGNGNGIYRIREMLDFEVRIRSYSENAINSVVNVSVPDCNLTKTMNMVLDPDEVEKYPFSVKIPTNLTPKRYTITVQVAWGDFSKDHIYSIPVSKLEVAIAGGATRNSGDRFDLSIKNVGGVDTGITSTARLLDPRYFVVAKERIMDFLMAGEAKSYSITIPSESATDQYLLIVRAFDNTTSWEARQDKAISVSGASATIEVATDGLSYPRTSEIKASAEGVNGPIALDGASIAFEAYETNKGIPMLYKDQWGHQEEEMSYPTGVAVDGQARVYVVDSLSNGGEERMIVKVFDPWGGLIASFASDRQEPGSLQFPHSIALDEERGLIYLTNRDHITVYYQDNWTYAGDIIVAGQNFAGKLRDLAYDGNGTLYATAGWGAGNMVYKFSTNGTLIKGWGTFYNGLAAGPGQFNEPFGLEISNNGSWIYVADLGNHRVQVFDTNGTYLFSFGGFGTNESLFNLTLGIAIDEEGMVYVGDYENCRIQVFNATGGFQYSFGSKGYANGAMNHPYYLAIQGDVLYVADYHNHRVQRFDLTGTSQAAWGGPDLERPAGISYDRYGNIYVLEDVNNRVLKYDNDGNFIKEWTLPNPGYWYGQDYDIDVDRINDWVYVSNHSPDPLVARYWILKFDLNGTYLNVWYSEGHEVAVDTEGYVYSISHHGTLFKYNSTGSLVQEMPGINGGGLAVDNEGFIYVAYRGYDFGVIDIFDSVGKLVRRFDTAFKYGPQEIHVDGRGDIYFSDYLAGKIVKMYRNGTYAWESSLTGYTEGLTVDDEGNIFMGSSIWQYGPSFYNSTIYKYEQPGYSPIWSDKSTIDVASGKAYSANVSADPAEIGTEGKYWMRGVLRSSLGQVLSWDETPFFLADGNISLTMVTNRRGYLLDEPIEIDCVVWNYASFSRVTRVVIWKDSVEVLNRTYSVPPLGSVRFLVTFTANASFLLKGLVTVEGTRGSVVDSMTTLEYIPVGPPVIDALIDAPYYVGMGPFTATLRVRNAWQEPVDLHVSFLGSEKDVHLGPEQVMVMAVETSLIADTTITAYITGDAVFSVSRYVRLAERVHVTISSQMFDHDGELEIPYSIENLYNRDCRFQVRFVIGDQVIVKDHFLSAYATSTETLSLTLVAGIYLLNFSTPMQEGSVVLNVATPDLIVTECIPQTLGAGMDSSIFFRVSNQGPVDGNGEFRVTIPGIFQDTRTIHCTSGSTIEVWFNFTLPDDIPSATVGIEYSIDGRNGGLTTSYMMGHSIEVRPVLDKDLYLNGEIIKLNVSMRYNALVSNYTLRVQFGDFENTTAFHLESYGSAFFLFDIPVVLTGEKLFVSVNLPSGRSLYINYIDVREKMENTGVLVTLDSKFNTGSMMNINVTTLREGLVDLTTPWGSWSGTVSGTKFVQMPIPMYVVSGTYDVDHQFGDMIGSTPFYVSGCEAAVIGASISGDLKIGGEFSATIKVWSNRYAEYEVRSSLIAPNGEGYPNTPLVISLVPGMNTISVGDMTSVRTGTHVLAVDIMLINETGSRSGSVSSRHRIDIAGPSILSMRTDKTSYLSDEELKLSLHVLEPMGAELAVLIDDEEVAYTGDLGEYCTISVGLLGLKERMHQLKVVLRTGTGDEVSGAFTNFNMISPYLSVNAAPSMVNVSASSYVIDKGSEVAFHATFMDIDGDEVNVSWDFGDGKSASGSDVKHRYDRKGTYTVTVTAYDTKSHSTSESITMVVRGEEKEPVHWWVYLLIAFVILILILIIAALVVLTVRSRVQGAKGPEKEE
ncbi:MAG: PKD domain-containing protein [Candidatus Thermoplasmatota archaeon]|jgi:DNA-binding beta-propeller fold protein YncE/transglutaminase-like putative cysteine protease|nr:PKD domain-containing protein [Candidatus Thermoplasmatota archaeon]